MELKLAIIFFFTFLAGHRCHDLKDFDSPIHYKLQWPGEDGIDPAEFEKEGYESMLITTSDMEKYKCMIPPAREEKSQKETDGTTLSPLSILKPLFVSKICSYRFENYWSYELCHGSHIKQYHEERDGKNIKVQEYYLGLWDATKMQALEEQVRKDMESSKTSRTIKIDNVKYPYFEMEMSDGTSCDLINQSRMTRVRYICYPHGKNEIFSLKETSTCNYEMIVLTSALCILPAFQPETNIESEINCIPLEGAPYKPLSMLKEELEELKLRHKPIPDTLKPKDSIAIIKVDTKDGTLHVDIVSPRQNEKLLTPETKPEDEVTPAIGSKSSSESTSSLPVIPSSSLFDFNPVIEFLEGKYCLIGGSGWWQYEFCYGKHIRQFHDKTPDKKSQMLGFFDSNIHREWLRNNVKHRPMPKSIRTHVTHFYSDGTICDQTGEKRQTIVKLKCGGTELLSPSAVSLLLLEPETCKYVLTVETKLICDILQEVDEDGLIPDIRSFADSLIEKRKTDQAAAASGRGESMKIEMNEKSNSVNERKSSKGEYVGNIVVEDIEVRYEND